MWHQSLVAVAAWAVTAVGANPPPRSQIQLVGTQRFDVYYEIPPGALPLDSVQLWYTFDAGRSWTHFGDDDDRQSPMVFDAPREGLCGLYLILTNEAGASGPQPQVTTEPHQWVFIDYTEPVCQLHAPVLTRNRGGRAVQLTWTAIDNQLTARPITLEYLPANANAWQALAKRLPNTGRYDWAPPDGLAGTVQLRMSVADSGGHETRCTNQADLGTPTAPAARVSPAATDAVNPLVTVDSRNRAVSARRSTDDPLLAMIAMDDATPPRDVRPPPWVGTNPADGVRERDRLRALELVHRARRHARDGALQLAVDQYRDAVRINPGLDQALVELGRSLYALGRLDEAIQAFDRVLARAPLDRDALIGSARVLVKQGHFADAQQRLHRIVEHDPRDAAAWLYLGDVAIYRGDEVLARDFYTKAATMAHEDIDTVDKATRRLRMLPDLTRQYARTESAP